jgi:spore coat polysaccharide biosynthesis predicted glycosyltransferase SpsG
VPPGCELLLGAQFALLRPEFAALRPASLARRRDGVSRILVSMGGSDPFDETSKVLLGLSRLPGEPPLIDVVIGDSNAHGATVASACARLARATLHVQTPRMAELMAAADCAICAAGNITWERCALGLPGLTTILADKQAASAEAVNTAGGHQLMGWHHALVAHDYMQAVLALDPARLSRMSAAAAKICDGRGVARVTQRLSDGGHWSKSSFGALHA